MACMSGLGMLIQGNVRLFPPPLSMRSIVTARALPQITAAATMSLMNVTWVG